MTTTTALRNRYVTDSVDTMSPARALVALYDRLSLDLDRAHAAIGLHDFNASHAALVHAQEIVTELHDTLDLEAWPAGAQLANVYRYLLTQLVSANLAKSAALVAECRAIVEPLRVAWREAAGVAGSAGGATP